MAWFMDTVGPMTKTVEDAALVFQTIAGHDPKDQYTSGKPLVPFEPVATLTGMRVGLIREGIDKLTLTEPAFLETAPIIRSLLDSTTETRLVSDPYNGRLTPSDDQG